MNRLQNSSPPFGGPNTKDYTRDHIFSSEIARAVCGYLTSTGCHASREAFIGEHSDLTDFNMLVQKGLMRTVDSDIEGMGLIDILNEYVIIKKEIDQLVQNILPDASQLGLLRSDGPLRKLKMLAGKFTSNTDFTALKTLGSEDIISTTSSKKGLSEDIPSLKASNNVHNNENLPN